MNKHRLLGSALAFGLLSSAVACASDEVVVSPPEAGGSASTAVGSTEPQSEVAPPGSSASVSSSSVSSSSVSSSPGSAESGSGASNCSAAELSLALGAANGAAGSTELPIEFSNTGSRTCTLDGYPGVSYVAEPGGSQVGSAAVRTGSEMSPVELAPGATATAMVKAAAVGNYPADQCQPQPVSGLDVYSPNTTEVVYLAYPTTGCATDDASITQLFVQPVSAG